MHSFTGQREATERGQQLEAVDEDGEEYRLGVGLQVVHRAVAHHVVEVQERQDEVLAAYQLAAVFVDQVLHAEVADLAEYHENLALDQRLGDADEVAQDSDDV